MWRERSLLRTIGSSVNGICLFALRLFRCGFWSSLPFVYSLLQAQERTNTRTLPPHQLAALGRLQSKHDVDKRNTTHGLDPSLPHSRIRSADRPHAPPAAALPDGQRQRQPDRAPGRGADLPTGASGRCHRPRRDERGGVGCGRPAVPDRRPWRGPCLAGKPFSKLTQQLLVTACWQPCDSNRLLATASW
jgi:hypothetical protein